MIVFRVVLATAILLLCVRASEASNSLLVAQSHAAEASDREPKTRERTPPPRPIVPPAGQQENPALRAECAWIGQRIVSLLFRDDPMTGNDFVPFYTRFGCPEPHLTQAFACVVSAGSLENDALADRIALCWADPTQKVTAKAGEAKPAEGKPAEGKPSDAKAPDAKSPDAKPEDGKPNDTKPGESRPAEGKGGTPPAKPADGTQK